MNLNNGKRVILKPKRKRLESERSTTSSGISQLSTSTHTTELSSGSHLTSEISSVVHESQLGTSENNCDPASLVNFGDDDVERDQVCGRPRKNLTRFFLEEKDDRIECGERSTNLNTTAQRTVLFNAITNKNRSQEASTTANGLWNISNLPGHFAPVTSNIYEPISSDSIYTPSADYNGYLTPITKGVPVYNDLNLEEESVSLVGLEESSDDLTEDNDFQINHSGDQCLRSVKTPNSCHQQVGDTISRCDKSMVVGCHRLAGIVFGIFSIIIIMLNVVALTFIYVSRSHTEGKGGVQCHKCDDENWQEFDVTVMSPGLVKKDIWCCLNSKMDFTYLLKEFADVSRSKYDISSPERSTINDEDLLGKYMGTAYIKLEADGKTISEPSGAKMYWKKRPIYAKNITLTESQSSIAIQTVGYYFVYSRIYLSFSPKGMGVTYINSNCRIDIRLMKPTVYTNNYTKQIMIDDVSQTLYAQNFTTGTEHLSVLQCLQYLKAKDEISVSVDVEYCDNVKISTQSSLTLLLISK